MTRKIFATSVLVLMAVLLAVSANASQISQASGTVDLLGSDYTWNVNAFDTSLGTLDSVTVKLWTTVDGQWNVTNIGTVNVHTWGYVDGFTQAGFDIAPGITGSSNASDSAKWNVVLTPAGAGNVVSGAISGADSKSYGYNKVSNNLTPFYTDWSVVFQNDSDAKDKNVPATANFMNYVSGTGKAEVCYNYTPTPEPSSLMVLMFGGAGLVGFMRRRKA